MTKKTSIYTPKFILICICSLLFSSSFNMLLPELPEYLSSLGGDEYKGLIIALFTLTAGVSRPFSGKLTDTIGRKPVMIFGALVCVICGLLYPLLSTVIGFLFLRFFHGFSTGFTPTAISAYVADIIPQKRWGEAIGVQGLFFSTGFALGPVIGSFIKLHYSFDVLFYSSFVMSLLSVVAFLTIKESLQNKQTFSFQILKISKNEIIAKEVLPAAILTFVYYIPFGALLTIIPDWSSHLGIVNKGSFFIYFTVSSLVIRFISGKASDVYGRPIVMKIGMFLLIVSLLYLGYFVSEHQLYIGACFYGSAMGILSPTINAWNIDLSIKEFRGKAIATRFIALEAGIGLGAILSGWYFKESITKVPNIFYFSSFIIFLGMIYLLLYFRKTKKLLVKK